MQGLAVYALAGRLVRELEAMWSGYLGPRRFGQLKTLLAALSDALAAAEE